MLRIYLCLCISVILSLAVRASPIEKNISKTERSGKLRIVSLIQHPRREYDYKNHSQKDIVFPDQYDNASFHPVPVNGIPKCSRGDTFCENFDAYPKRHLREVLRRKGGHSEYFGKDEDMPILVNRHGGLEESINFMCPSVEKTIFPKLGMNKKNKWRYIINQGEDGYIQGVRVEICRRKNEPCDIIGDMPLGYVTSCKQKYVYRRLLSVNDLGSPIPDTFQLPSACCCSYKRDMDFLARHSNQKLKVANSAESVKQL